MATSPVSPLTFALVGCGAISPTHAKAIAALPGSALLTHCCDENAELAKAFAAKFGGLKIATFDELLADPTVDVITFCTPSGLHAALGVRALEAGKHVVIEKPMEITTAACDLLIAAQRASGRKLAIISQHRFDPSSQLVNATLSRGELGKLVLAEARVPWHRSQEYYDSGAWRGTWALDGGGCLMNQGIHTVDLLLWLAGPVKTVFAQMRTAAHERIEVEDVVTATLTFANGAIGNLTATTAAYPGFPAYIGLHGTQGSAIIEGDELKLLAIKGRETVHGQAATAHALQVATGGTRSATANAAATVATAAGTNATASTATPAASTSAPNTARAAPTAAASATSIPPASPPVSAWAWGDAHREQFADFIRAVHNNGTPLVDGIAGRAAVQLINAVYESARTGRVVTL